MFNIRLRNLFIVLFLLISLILTYGCSSKPSEEKMKSAIKSLNTIKVTNINYDKFEIKKEFNKKINNKDNYCISVNMKGKLSLDKGKTYQEFSKEDARFCFVKGVFNWHAKQGWPD